MGKITEYEWDGVTKSYTLSKEYNDEIQNIFKGAINNSWENVIDKLRTNIRYFNSVQPNFKDGYTLLHYVAKSLNIYAVKELIKLGAGGGKMKRIYLISKDNIWGITKIAIDEWFSSDIKFFIVDREIELNILPSEIEELIKDEKYDEVEEIEDAYFISELFNQNWWSRCASKIID